MNAYTEKKVGTRFLPYKYVVVQSTWKWLPLIMRGPFGTISAQTRRIPFFPSFYVSSLGRLYACVIRPLGLSQNVNMEQGGKTDNLFFTNSPVALDSIIRNQIFVPE